MTKCTEKEIKITKSCSKGKKERYGVLQKNLNISVSQTDSPCISFSYFFSFNLISLKLDKWVAMYVSPLGVKKTQEICSMVTESLIIGH